MRERRFKCLCAYDGTDFYGWQSQAGGNTVQDFIEARLAVVFKKPIRIHGSGRTDSGVHAKGQVFHFDADWPHDTVTLHRALRGGLPQGIQVSRVSLAPAHFHARYRATGKRYSYNLFIGEAPPMETRYAWSLGERALGLDVAAMQAAAQSLLGEHDFSAFSAARGKGSNDENENPVKDLRRLDIVRKGCRVKVTTEASGYLYKMVRSLVGALVEVGLGKVDPGELVRIRDSGKRTVAVPTAPARGLCLEKVFYR